MPAKKADGMLFEAAPKKLRARRNRANDELIVEPPPFPANLPEFFPDDVNGLKRVAVVFCKTFGGCTTTDAIKKHGPAYAEALASVRQRGFPTRIAWEAFSQALSIRSGRPLFGAEAKKALSYLPSRAQQNAAPIGKRRSLTEVDEHLKGLE